MKIFIKAYGICEILKREGRFALIKTPKGSLICYNILGLEIFKEELF